MSRRHNRYNFDAFAQTYDLWYETDRGQAHDRMQKSDVATLLQSPERGMRLLDIGCGTGHWSQFFTSMGYAVVGVDVSCNMVATARARAASPVLWAVADACALPFQDSYFDVVAAMATLEFVADPSTSLHEMVRSSRAGGRIVIGTLNRLAALNRKRMAELREPYLSARLYSPAEIYDLLSPFGPVRMVASDPDTAHPENNSHKIDRRSAEMRIDGPFIVAEVRR